MKKLIILFLFLILTKSGIAQWEWQNPIPTSNALYGIEFQNDSIVFCVGDGGFLMKSDDSGHTWKNINSKTSLFLNDICIIDDKNLVAVGHDATICRSNDGGESWQIVNSGFPPSSFRSLYDVFFIDKKVGWICGRGCVLKTTDGGNSWEIIYLTTYDEFTSIHFFNNNEGLLCKWSIPGYTGLFQTSDGGNTWLPLNTGFDEFRKMMFINDSTGYIIGEEGLILKTTDSAHTWQKKISYTDKSLRGIDFLNNYDGVIVGVDGCILVTSDAGETWANVSNQNINIGHLYDVSFNDAGLVISAGVKGELIKSLDHGITWESIRKGYLNTLNSIWMLNQDEGWIVGNSGLILKTSNGGNDWSAADSLTYVNLNDIFFISDSICWIVGDSGQVFRSDDFGQNWESINQFGSIDINSIYFLTDEVGWVAGSNGSILKTTDGGLNWISQNSNSNHDLRKIYFVDENFGWCTEPVVPIRTTDGGNSWYEEPHLYAANYSIQFIDDYIGWAIGGMETIDGNFGMICRTYDKGESWQRFSFGYKYVFYDGYFINSMDGWIFGKRKFWGGREREGVIAFTADGGENLVFQRSSAATTLFSASIINDTKIWVVGEDGTILKNDSAYIITNSIEEEIKVVTDFSLSQNYPNPFNPTTKIKFTIPQADNPLRGGARSRFTTLKVYDILGREIATLVNEQKPAGEYEVEFNGANLPSGIYFYQLNAGDYRETRKMVLLK